MQDRGIRLKVEQLNEGLLLRGTLPKIDGTRRCQRLSLGLKATQANLLHAEDRAIALAAAIANGAYPANGIAWAKPAPTSADEQSEQLRVVEAIARLESEFWNGRVRSEAAERTWDRITTEQKRLPSGAYLTTDLLLATAAMTPAGSRTRLETCKVFKRLGRLVKLEGLERIDALRTPYEPAERELPTDAVLLELLERVRSHREWGWRTAAAMIYGCRPSEVFSLQPATDGTARVPTVKQRGKLPSWRTALALPVEWAKRFDLQAVKRPCDYASPSTYSSLESKQRLSAGGSSFNAKRRSSSSTTYGTPGRCAPSAKPSMPHWRRSVWATAWPFTTRPTTAGWTNPTLQR